MAARLSDGLAEANLHVRSLAHGMVPVPVRAGELLALLRDLARSIEEGHRISCSVECSTPLDELDDVVATHLYRIAQEAARNAIRHSRARSILIRLERSEAGLFLEVWDDGTGIEPHAASRRGVGLRLMEHRCELIGGRLAVERGQERGTRVVCAVFQRPKR
jgi:two-component system, LuxR family, sensor kinase FixL